MVDDAEPTGEKHGAKNRTPSMVFLTKKEVNTKQNINAYLDSGANAHIFKTKDAFTEIKTKQTNLITAIGGENTKQKKRQLDK